MTKAWSNAAVDLTRPVALFQQGTRRIYWVGSVEDTPFRCNAYLLGAQGEWLLVDPGGVGHFPQVVERVRQVVDPARVRAIVVHHQDPDLCASLPLWRQVNPDVVILTHSRAAVLLPHYGLSGGIETVDHGSRPLADGTVLRFLPAPFLHFPGAFATYDPVSGFLFSGDICAALSADWQLFADDWERHLGLMELFHVDYMASNRALRGFLRQLDGLEVRAILPQHGSVIPPEGVGRVLQWLRELPCGLDLIYPREAGADAQL